MSQADNEDKLGREARGQVPQVIPGSSLLDGNQFNYNSFHSGPRWVGQEARTTRPWDQHRSGFLSDGQIRSGGSSPMAIPWILGGLFLLGSRSNPCLGPLCQDRSDRDL